jgi:beta-mannosidase
MDEYIFVDLDNEDREMSPLKRQSLSNNWEWKQRPENVEDLEALAGQEGWSSTSVPTEVFKDLLESGRIADPFLDRNEDAVQWVGEADWMYRTKFPIERVPGPGEKAVLVLEGLDTFASVYLNGKLILTSDVSPCSAEVDQRTCSTSTGLMSRDF